MFCQFSWIQMIKQQRCFPSSATALSSLCYLSFPAIRWTVTHKGMVNLHRMHLHKILHHIQISQTNVILHDLYLELCTWYMYFFISPERTQKRKYNPDLQIYVENSYPAIHWIDDKSLGVQLAGLQLFARSRDPCPQFLLAARVRVGGTWMELWSNSTTLFTLYGTAGKTQYFAEQPYRLSQSKIEQWGLPNASCCSF